MIEVEFKRGDLNSRHSSAMSADVILIGNGRIAPDCAEWVERSAFVVRFNIPRHVGAKNGVRCDALCITNHGFPARRFAKFRKLLNQRFVHPTTEIWIPRPRKYRSISCFFNHPSRRIRWQTDHSSHIIKRNGLEKLTQVFFSEEIWNEAFSTISLDRNQEQVSPSTGFLALTYCLRRFPPALFNIHLIGFSFEGSQAHPWKLEKAAVERMVERGQLFWNESGVPQTMAPTSLAR